MAAFLKTENAAPRRDVAFPRTRLAARWQATPDGKLICVWQAEIPVPARPPF